MVADLREFLVVTKVMDLVQTLMDLEDKSMVHLVRMLMLMLTLVPLTLEDLVDMDPFLEDPEVTEDLPDMVVALSVVKAVDLEMMQIFTVDMLEVLPEPTLTPTPMQEPPELFMELSLEDLEVTEDPPDTVVALLVVKAVDLEIMVQIFTVDMLEVLPESTLTPTPMPEPPELFMELSLEDLEITVDPLDTVVALSVVKAVDLEIMVQIFTVDMLEVLPEPTLTPTLMPMLMPEPPELFMELSLEDLEVTEDLAKAHSMAMVVVDVHNVTLPV